MEYTGINIRSAFEDLNLPIKEIFQIETGVSGDKRLKELHHDGNRKTFAKYPDLQALIEKESNLFFTEKKTIHKLNDTLIAYVFDYYFAYQDTEKHNKIICEKNVEIEFVNTEVLDFDMYCENLMLAQSFTGNYTMPEYLYPFIGIGTFDLSEYAAVHPLVMNSNCNMSLFFLYYNKVLSSINHFISAMYEYDLKSQRRYMTDQEYKSAMKTLRAHKKMINAQIKQRSSDNDFDEHDEE